MNKAAGVASSNNNLKNQQRFLQWQLVSGVFFFPLETESAVYHILFKEAFGSLNSEKAEVLELKVLSLTTLQTS